MMILIEFDSRLSFAKKTTENYALPVLKKASAADASKWVIPAGLRTQIDIHCGAIIRRMARHNDGRIIERDLKRKKARVIALDVIAADRWKWCRRTCEIKLVIKAILKLLFGIFKLLVLVLLQGLIWRFSHKPGSTQIIKSLVIYL